MGEQESSAGSDPTVNDLPPDIGTEDAAAPARAISWPRYAAGAMAGGISAFLSGLIVVFLWDTLVVWIDFGVFEWLWGWRFVLFFYYQKVPLEWSVVREDLGFSTEKHICVLTVVGILIFVLMFLSGRLAARIAKPKTIRGAVFAGASICIPYTAACLILFPFARYSPEVYSADVTEPILRFVVVMCFFWSCLFGAWGGMRQFKGRAPLRKGLAAMTSRLPELSASLVMGLRNAAKVLLLACLVGSAFFVVMAVEEGVPYKDDIPTLINEAPGMSAIAFSSAMGVPMEDERFTWLYGSPFEYLDNNLAYGDLAGSGKEKGSGEKVADIFFVLGTLAVFICGSLWLIRNRGSTRVSGFLLSLLSWSVLFSLGLLLLASGEPESTYALFFTGFHINAGLIILFGLAWTMGAGLLSFGVYLGYIKLPPLIRLSSRGPHEGSQSAGEDHASPG